MNGQPDEALELVSVETRPSINTVIYKDFSALTPVPSAMSCIARRLLSKKEKAVDRSTCHHYLLHVGKGVLLRGSR